MATADYFSDYHWILCALPGVELEALALCLLNQPRGRICFAIRVGWQICHLSRPIGSDVPRGYRCYLPRMQNIPTVRKHLLGVWRTHGRGSILDVDSRSFLAEID